MTESYVQRLIEEHKQLAERLTKLEVFLVGKEFESLDWLEQLRLREQRYYMEGYFDVLEKRVNDLSNEDLLKG